MLTNKKLLLPGIGLAVVAALAVVIGVVAASDGDGSDDASTRDLSGDENDRIADPGSGLAMCAEDVPDCDDMIVDPNGNAADDPDKAAYSDPAVSGPTSGDDIAPDECNLVHNIDACQLRATGAATNDLVGRLGIQPEQVDLLSAELTEWPNACIGIDQPDVACAEVITTGFKIVLAAGDTEYEYHTDATGSQALLAE
jgi:hypothetical protein